MLRKLLSFILIFAIILSIPGCSKNNEETSNEISTYHETHFAQTAGLISPAGAMLNSKGQLIVYDWGQSPPSFITIDSEGNRISAFESGTEGASVMFTLDASDNLYVLSQKRVMEQASGKHTANEVAIKIFSSSGSLVKSIDLGIIPVNREREPSFTDIAVDSKSNIYLLKKDGSIDVLDEDGHTVKNISKGKYIFLETDINDHIIVCGVSEKGGNAFIEAIDPDNGKTLWKLDMDQQPVFMNYYPSDNSLYTVDTLGIKKCDLKKLSIKPIMDFFKNNPGNLIDISSVNVLASETVYITFFDSSSILKYSLSTSSLEDNPVKELTFFTSIGASDSKATVLKTAAELMKKEYPDIEIKFTFPDDNNYSDQLKSLYTALMAGSGPDVIDVHHLPYKKIADKNMLVNLDEMIEKDKEFDTSAFYQNIIEAARYKGILYMMPITFWFKGFVGDNEIIEETLSIDDAQWTWDDFYTIAQKLTKDTDNDGIIDRYALVNDSIHWLFLNAVEGMYSQFVNTENKECSFYSEKFINLMLTFKKLGEIDIMHPTIDSSNVPQGLGKSVAFLRVYIGSLTSLNIYKRDYFETTKIGFYKFPQNSSENKTTCILTSALAINRNSKLKDESWKLITIMTKEEILSNTYLDFVINKNAERARQQQVMQWKGYTIDQSELEELNTLIESCNDILYVDNEIYKIVRDETKPFFSGQKTAEETAQAIQDKVTTCLNE